MKTKNLFLTLLLLSGICLNLVAQSHDHNQMTTQKTESFKVLGKCDMCKARIEKTVKAEGVTSATWDAKTQLLSITFGAGKTNIEALSRKLASVGHDTEKFKAPDEVYAKLPDCCHYDRSK